MSSSLLNIFASLPRTNRGQPIVLGGDPKLKNILYVNGNSVFIRNIENPFECDVYTEHSCPVHVAKYSQSGFYIASADQSGKVRIWDTTNKEHILKNEFQPISGVIKDLQWSSDNQRIIVGGEGREKFGHVFNAETGTSVGEIMGTSKAINSVDFKSSRPFRAVVASEDSTIAYFEGPPFKWKKSHSEHDRFVNVIRYSPNGEKFASGGADGKIFIFDGKTGDKLSELGKPAHAGGVYSLSWDPSSQKLLTVSGDKTAKVWNVEDGSLIKEFSFGNTIEDQQVGCLWQGTHLLTVSLSGFINYLNLNGDGDNSILRVVKGHTKSVNAVAVSQDKYIYSASHDGLIIRWNSSNGEMNAISGSQHTNKVQSLAIDNSTNTMVSVGFDDTLKFIDIASQKYVDEIKLDSQPQGLVFCSNDVYVVAGIKHLMLIKNRKKVAALTISYEATCISYNESTNQLAVGGKDNKTHVYNFNKNANDAGSAFSELKTIDERDYITSVAFSSNGVYLAVADNSKNIKCYLTNNNSYENITRDMWQHHAGRITQLAWSPDSKHLASSAIDTHCMIYSPENVMSYIQIKNAHPLNPVNCCAWLDDATLVSGSQDCCLRKWKITY